MKVFDVKAVHGWDGGDRRNFSFYIDASVSDEEIKRACQLCQVVRTPLVILDSLEEREELKSANLRRSAWAKLTPLERKALGMTEEPK